MVKERPELIVALDVDTLEEIRTLVDVLDDSVDIYKIGSQAFTACGPAAVRFVLARGKRVFLDLKYHDIPNTVASAVRAAVSLPRAVERNVPISKESPQPGKLFMVTLHTCGGEEMMRAAVQASAEAANEFNAPRPLIVGVTVLTSQEAKQGLTDAGQGDNILPLVLERAALARRAGLDGVVASCHEAAAIRKQFGPDFVIVTPGIRPVGTDVGDQKRVATPKAAVENGSHFLVVGRPVVRAPDPQAAARQILNEIRF
ncbi:MAG: orotidine-5'-phosphate decarboxylase [Candidatus Omnitrophota bacterium]